MTKKRSLERIEGNFFFKIFCLKINLPKSFPPNIYDKSTPVENSEFGSPMSASGCRPFGHAFPSI